MIIFNDVLLSVMFAGISDCAILFLGHSPKANRQSERFFKTKVSNRAYARATSFLDQCAAALLISIQAGIVGRLYGGHNAKNFVFVTPSDGYCLGYRPRASFHLMWHSQENTAAQ